MKMLSYIILGAFIIIIGGCTDDKGTDGNGTNELVPLALNNEWRGTLRTYSSQGDLMSEYPFTYQLFAEVNTAEETWYSMRYIIDYSEIIDPQLVYVNRDDGLWEQSPCGNLVCRVELWGKYPAVDGQSFVVNHIDYHEIMVDLDSVDIDNIQTVYDAATVVSTNYDVTVPAGTFSCYRYVWQPDPASNSNLLYFYVAPNLGFVKKEEFDQVGGYLVESWELDSYIAN